MGDKQDSSLREALKKSANLPSAPTNDFALHDDVYLYLGWWLLAGLAFPERINGAHHVMQLDCCKWGWRWVAGEEEETQPPPQCGIDRAMWCFFYSPPPPPIVHHILPLLLLSDVIVLADANSIYLSPTQRPRRRHHQTMQSNSQFATLYFSQTNYNFIV